MMKYSFLKLSYHDNEVLADNEYIIIHVNIAICSLLDHSIPNTIITQS